jgi:hypothetical protein
MAAERFISTKRAWDITLYDSRRVIPRDSLPGKMCHAFNLLPTRRLNVTKQRRPAQPQIPAVSSPSAGSCFSLYRFFYVAECQCIHFLQFVSIPKHKLLSTLFALSCASFSMSAPQQAPDLSIYLSYLSLVPNFFGLSSVSLRRGLVPIS